ncbi:MAG: hypothetical protein ABFS35_08465 [Bacteroidota bacterium]
MRIKFIILYIISVFVGKQINAQEITANAKLDTFQIEIGDQVYLKLNVVQPNDRFVAFPKFKNQIIDGIDIVSITKIDTIQSANNELTLTQGLLITSFDDSLFNIPPLPFISGNDTIYSNSISFDVQMVNLDSAAISKIDTSQVLKIFDVKQPIDTPLTFKEFLQHYYLYFIGFVVLVLIGFLIYYVIKRRKENKPLFKISKPKEPAHIIALRGLNELKQKKLWQTGKEKAYYSELTRILREYLENRFQISALDKTSHELLELIKHSNIIEKERYLELSQILMLGDLAKFAKFKPLPDENDLSLKNAFSIIENTIPKVEESVDIVEEEQIDADIEINESVNSKRDDK